MKKLSELKNIHNIFVDSINELDEQFKVQMAKIKQEYQKNMIDEKLKLLLIVCNGEKLDFDKIKTKYFKVKELLKTSVDNNTVIDENTISDEQILDKIEINGKHLYYENKENGKVYDINSKYVGNYKKGNFIFN